MSPKLTAVLLTVSWVVNVVVKLQNIVLQIVLTGEKQRRQEFHESLKEPGEISVLYLTSATAYCLLCLLARSRLRRLANTSEKSIVAAVTVEKKTRGGFLLPRDFSVHCTQYYLFT